MNYVIGSGPAGVAAAAALLDRGQPVTMVDAGGELEPAVQSTVDHLAAQQPERWDREAVQRIKGAHLRYNTEGAPLKLVFGSDYPYRDVDRLQPVSATGVDAYRALAAGGLSVLWGASILPFSDADFDEWPVTSAQMHPHYISALEMTGLTGDDDALSRIYPLHVPPTTLAISAQARFVAARARHHAADLEREHVYVGQARLAIRQPTPAGQSCVYCGMCLYGCPYGLIYSARMTLSTRLMTSPSFTYVPGLVVRRISESGGGVLIEAESHDGQSRTFEASRAFLAAGVLESTAILLRSSGAPQSVTLRQSDHFLMPLWLSGFHGRVAEERLHTLSQLFIEVLDRSVSSRGVHLQMYTYSDFYPRMAKDTLGPVYPLLAPLVECLLDRTALLKGYLHSDESSAIRAQLAPGTTGSTLRLDAVPSTRASDVIRAVSTLLRKHRRHLGASPVRFARRTGRPGSGVHVGGSFPMRQRPGEFESDILGRPMGMAKIHVVDATVFPTLPAAPPTLTIMANASRIVADTFSDHPNQEV